MLKSCKYCGRIHDSKIICKNKPIQTRKIKHTEQLRYTTAMKKKSLEIKQNANFVCEKCLDENIISYEKLETHHIVKLQESPELALDNLNLICLCSICHEKAEKGHINADYLRKLAIKREKHSPGAFNYYI